MNLVLIFFALKYKGYFHKIYNALKNKEFVPPEEIEKIKTMIENNKIQAITIVDDEYPESLKEISNPPFVLFYKGNKELLKNQKIVFIGEFQNKIINEFVDDSIKEITKLHTIVSNGYKGVDQTIFNLVLKNNKDIILVSPNGLIDPYLFNSFDDEILNNGHILLLSEFPDNSNINKSRLIERNKLTIGLAKSLIIASSNIDSPINNMVSFALEQGKDVYCFPGLQTSNDGNNKLIKEGAIMIHSIKELRV